MIQYFKSSTYEKPTRSVPCVSRLAPVATTVQRGFLHSTLYCDEPLLCCRVMFFHSAHSQLSRLQLCAGWGNIFLRLNVGFLPQIAVSPAAPSTPPPPSSSSSSSSPSSPSCFSSWCFSSSPSLPIYLLKKSGWSFVWGVIPQINLLSSYPTPSLHPSHPLYPHISSYFPKISLYFLIFPQIASNFLILPRISLYHPISPNTISHIPTTWAQWDKQL